MIQNLLLTHCVGLDCRSGLIQCNIYCVLCLQGSESVIRTTWSQPYCQDPLMFNWPLGIRFLKCAVSVLNSLPPIKHVISLWGIFWFVNHLIVTITRHILRFSLLSNMALLCLERWNCDRKWCFHHLLASIWNMFFSVVAWSQGDFHRFSVFSTFTRTKRHPGQSFKSRFKSFELTLMNN